MNRTLLPLIEAEFVRYKLLGERALRQVRPEELHARGDDGNSVAIIVWHLAGNLESKFTDLLTTDGEKPWRDRDSEFAPRDVSLAEVAEKWERGWQVLFGALAELNDDDLAAPITIRGVPFRVDEALLRSLAQHLPSGVDTVVSVDVMESAGAIPANRFPPIGFRPESGACGGSESLAGVAPRPAADSSATPSWPLSSLRVRRAP